MKKTNIRNVIINRNFVVFRKEDSDKIGSYCTGYLGETGYDNGSQATEGGYFGNIICLKNV